MASRYDSVPRPGGAFVPVESFGRCWLCPNPPKHRGYCGKCYRKMLSGAFDKVKTTVVIPAHVRNGILIPEHTQERMVNGKRELTPYNAKDGRKIRPKCSKENCNRASHHSGLCERCYFRDRRRREMIARIQAGDVPSRPGRLTRSTLDELLASFKGETNGGD